MRPIFADVEYSEQDIPISSVVESDSQPAVRNDITDPKRVKLLKSMERDGQKDRIDVVPVGDKFQVIEGHGRVLVAATLGWKAIAAKVYHPKEGSRVEHSRIRQAIFEANDTVLRMTGAQWTEYIYREQRENGIDVKGLSKALDLYTFLKDNFDESEVEEYIIGKNVGPDSLVAARRAVREILGLPARGPMPQDVAGDVVTAFRWVVKHGMTRPVVDHFRDNKGHAEVRKAIHGDYALTPPRRRKTQPEEPIPEA